MPSLAVTHRHSILFRIYFFQSVLFFRSLQLILLFISIGEFHKLKATLSVCVHWIQLPVVRVRTCSFGFVSLRLLVLFDVRNILRRARPDRSNGVQRAGQPYLPVPSVYVSSNRTACGCCVRVIFIGNNLLLALDRHHHCSAAQSSSTEFIHIIFICVLLLFFFLFSLKFLFYSLWTIYCVSSMLFPIYIQTFDVAHSAFDSESIWLLPADRNNPFNRPF